MKNALSIFEFGSKAIARGERIVLVTIVGVLGRSTREPGTHMMISSSGSYVGSFSGGCVEAAVVAEALDVLARGMPRALRFGAGSPYIDIRLPCGGGVDLLFHPDPDLALLQSCEKTLGGRAELVVILDPAGEVTLGSGQKAGASRWLDGRFHAVHEPDLHLLIMGHGAEPLSLARVGMAYGASITILTPDHVLAEQARCLGAQAFHLQKPSDTSHVMADPWTAIIAVFHDHDWERHLLQQAVATEACFIGAMGSHDTHSKRIAGLVAAGVHAGDARKITGPVGLIPATRDPDTLALSIISQIVVERDLRRKTGIALHWASGTSCVQATLGVSENSMGPDR